MTIFRFGRRAALVLAVFLAAAPGIQAESIKFATLAPQGSTWMKIMTQFNRELRQRTNGALEFKIYAGGVQGDDKDVVRKMRIGEIDAAGLTGVGLGMIAPEVRILDSPWLFRNAREVDFIRRQFDPEFKSAFGKAGYVLLGWADLGFVYIFSRKPINGPADMRRQKMWAWEGDPIAAAAYQAVGASPIPLSVIDVMSSLETGLIDAVYGPPMGVIALQWFTKTKYIYSVPMAYASGAILISKRVFGRLPQKQQKILLNLGAKYLNRLNADTRRENRQALASLKKQGLRMSPPPTPAQLKLYARLGRSARRMLVGKQYSARLLDAVEKSLARLRHEKHPKS